MKILINGNDAFCLRCFVGDAVLNSAGDVVCSYCGRRDLIDHQGEIFQPLFEPAKTWQASRYTPAQPERRISQRAWPKIKERRAAHAH